VIKNEKFERCSSFFLSFSILVEKIITSVVDGGCHRRGGM